MIKKREVIGDLVQEYYLDESTGKQQGLFTLWEKGAKVAEGMYVDGNVSGAWNYWHSNGKIKEQGSYDAGKQVGEWRWYDESGKLCAVGYFVDGDESGEWREYLDDGKVLRGVWRDGVPWDGEFMINGEYYRFLEGGRLDGSGKVNTEK